MSSANTGKGEGGGQLWEGREGLDGPFGSVDKYSRRS